MRRIDRRLLAGVVLTTIVLLTLFAAPRETVRGSTYSRAPDGYGAWYAYMQRQGSPIKRWQSPLEDFAKQTKSTAIPETLLRINSSFDVSNSTIVSDLKNQEWIRQGNTLVILGAFAPVTEVPFSTMQTSQQGSVKIETARRGPFSEKNKQVLGDRFGPVVWQQAIGRGKVIFASTPFLAANAYQDQPGNFAFLAQLVKQNGNAVWVDEYMHGYQEANSGQTAQEGRRSWFAYLLNTPLLPVLVQTIVLLLVLIWANNRRLGVAVPLASPTINNSEAYIQALASVLYKAGRSEFAVELVGREEVIQLQQALGLGAVPLAPQAVVEAWVEQTGRPATELESILKAVNRKQRLREQDLLAWVKNIQTVHQHLP